MTTRILSALHSILEGVTLARTVLRLAREHDSLSTVTAELQSALDASLEREQAAQAQLAAALTREQAFAADVLLDSLTAQQAANEGLDHDLAIMRHNSQVRAHRARAWGKEVRRRANAERSRDAFERALRAEEGKTAVLRVQVARLELEPKSGRVAKGGA